MRVLDDGTVAWSAYGASPSGTVGVGVVLHPNGTYSTISYPGSNFTQLTGINSQGEIIGTFSQTLNNGTVATHCFLMAPSGSFTDLGTYPQIGPSGCNDINNGGSYLIGLPGSAAALVNPNGPSTFQYPNASTTEGTGINDLGQIVGWAAFCPTNATGQCVETPFLTSIGSSFTTISVPGTPAPPAVPIPSYPTGINNQGVIVGYYNENTSVGAGVGAFIRRPDGTYNTFIDPSGRNGLWFTGLNNNGQIAGYDLTSPFVATATPTFGSALRLAHIVDGSGWTTLFAIENLDVIPVVYTFNFWDDNGNALPIPFVNGSPGSLSGTLEVGATYFAQSPGTSSTLLEGWAEAASSGKIGVTAIFRYSAPGVPDSEGSVIGTASGSNVTMPYDNTQGYTTGIAVANTNPVQPLTISLSFQTDAFAQSTGQITLPPHGHTAVVLPSSFPATAGTRGAIRFSAPTPDMTVVGLRFTPSLSFTSLAAFQ